MPCPHMHWCTHSHARCTCLAHAGNHLAAVRIYAAFNNLAAAEQLVSSSRDPAAAFHMGRLYEAQGQVEEALRCYALSQQHAHGARLALK